MKEPTALKSLRSIGHRKKRGLRPSPVLSLPFIPSSLGLTPNVLTHGITCCCGPLISEYLGSN